MTVPGLERGQRVAGVERELSCPPHGLGISVYRKLCRLWAKELGLCPDCLHRKASQGRILCSRCLARQRQMYANRVMKKRGGLNLCA